MPNEIQLAAFSVTDIQAMAASVARDDGLDEHQSAVMLWLAQAEGHSLERVVEFLKRIEPDTTGCWIWTGSMTPNGYGKFYMGDRSPANWRMPDGSHRAAYRMFVGPIPEGLEIDHLCKTTECVKPFHLEAVTHWVNLMRSDSLSAKYAKQATCKRGHPKTPENIYFYKGKAYGCLRCQQMRDKARAPRTSHQKGVQ